MTSDEEGMEPFETSDFRPVVSMGRFARDVFHSPPEAVHDVRRAFLDGTGATDLFDVVQDVGQVVRVERHDLRRSGKVSRYILHVPEGGGAHFAEALRQNQVRIRGTKRP